MNIAAYIFTRSSDKGLPHSIKLYFCINNEHTAGCEIIYTEVFFIIHYCNERRVTDSWICTQSLLFFCIIKWLASLCEIVCQEMVHRMAKAEHNLGLNQPLSQRKPVPHILSNRFLIYQFPYSNILYCQTNITGNPPGKEP